MKENPDMDTYASDEHIDELLNGLIDGELTQRQRIEVQRLISHNAQIAERLAELQRCKMLVSSLPCAEAPAETAERVKDSLEARKPAIWQPEHFEQGVGARHLLFRRVLAAAAMIGLVAILAGVVYTIVRPASVADKTIVVRDWQPTRKAAVEKPATSVAATVEKPVAEIRTAAKGFNGRLELKTSALMAVDAFVSKAIENNGLLSVAGPRHARPEAYMLLAAAWRR